MKRLPWTLAITCMLIAIGFVAISLVRSQTEPSGESETALPQVLPTAIASFPDIEQVPIYPNATVTFTQTQGPLLNSISYQVPERLDKVAAFYQVMLPRQGWLHESGDRLWNLSSWSDPQGKLRWQLYLSVKMDWTVDLSRTVIYLEYGRYPNTEAGLPLYPDAQQVNVTRSNIEKRFVTGNKPVHVTEITYLSSTSPQEIATFYTHSLPEYGWRKQEPGWSTQAHAYFSFDNPGSWAGDSPGEGLYFIAVRPSWSEKSGDVSYRLLATATRQQDGQVRIKLHVEEFEDSLGNF